MDAGRKLNQRYFITDNNSSSHSISICTGSLSHNFHELMQGGPGNAIQVVGDVTQEEPDVREPEFFIMGSNLSELFPEEQTKVISAPKRCYFYL